MPADRLPSIVICGGAYHVPAHYETFAEALRAKGFEVRCPAMPTMHAVDMTAAEIDANDNEPEPPAEGYVSGYADVEVVRHEIKTFMAQGKRVLLIGHSYGGWVATESASPELQSKGGSAPGVVGMLYLTAMLLPQGESMFSFFAPKEPDAPPPAWIKIGKYLERGLVRPQKSEYYFYDGVPAEEAKRYTAMLRGQTIVDSVSTHLSYLDLPCAYLKCMNDNVFPPNVQDMYMRFVTDQGGKLKVFTCDAGHSPALTHLDVVVDTVIEFAKSL